MKKVVLSLICAILLALPSLQAQPSFGVRGGLNFQNMVGKSGGVSLEQDIALRYHLGVDVAVPVVPDFYIRSGLFFTTKGAREEVTLPMLGAFESSTSITYLQVPINLLYKPALGGGNLILAFGPYLGYAVGGSVKSTMAGEESSEDLSFGSGPDDDLKPFEMGAGISAGYMLGNGVYFQFNTQLGLSNLAIDGNEDNSIKNSGFGFSVGYQF